MRDAFGNLIKTDLSGRKISKKRLKKQVLAENIAKGKAAEDSYRLRAQLAGYEVERTDGRGHDFRVRKRDIVTGKVKYSGLREIKSSNTAPVTALQKKTKRKKSNYKVIRENPFPF